MNIFERILERLGVRRGEDRGMSISHDGRSSMDELVAQARMIAAAIHEEIKYVSRGEKLNIIQTGDLDNKGKLTPEARKRIEERSKATKR